MKFTLVMLCAAAASALPDPIGPIASLYKLNPHDGLYSLKTGLPYSFLRKRREAAPAPILPEVDQQADGSALFISPLRYSSLGYRTLGYPYIFRKKRDVDQQADSSALLYSPLRYSSLGYRTLGYPYIYRKKRDVDQQADSAAILYTHMAYPSYGYSTLGYPYIFRKKRDADQMMDSTNAFYSRYSRRGYSRQSSFQSARAAGGGYPGLGGFY